MQWRPHNLASLASLSARGALKAGIGISIGLRSVTSAATSNPPACHNIASVLALGAEADSRAPKPIEVIGHVRTVRNQKRRSFVELGDGSTSASLQALLEPGQAAGIGTGTSVKISGLWQPSPSGKEQSYELHARHVEILGAADPDTYPLQKKYHSNEFLRTIPHLRLRVPFNALLARLRSDCEYYISNYFHSREFIRAHTPIVTSSDCEGAGEVFTIQPRQDSSHAVSENEGQSGYKSSQSQQKSVQEFFREPKYLTVSSQLHLEAYVHEHPRVWTLSPTFRAEKSDTPRHLSEFYMLEAEIRTEKLDEVMDVVENLIREVASRVHKSATGQELLRTLAHTEHEGSSRNQWAKMLESRWAGLKKQYWPRISYSAAIDLLQAAQAAGEAKFQYQPEWQSGLQLEHEKFIADEIGCGSPVFVTDYPESVKPFYMLQSELKEGGLEAKRTVSCFDLLLPEVCEVVGGSLREHRLSVLEASMERRGLLSTRESADTLTNGLDWYVDLRRYGSVPHGGFGLGFDRLLCYMSGVESIRDMVPWPRYYGRCDG